MCLLGLITEPKGPSFPDPFPLKVLPLQESWDFIVDQYRIPALNMISAAEGGLSGGWEKERREKGREGISMWLWLNPPGKHRTSGTNRVAQ